MIKNHTQFLQYVFEYVKEYPEISARVTEYTTLALESKLKSDREHRSDIEALLLMSLCTRLFKNNNQFFINQLEKYKDKSSLQWDFLIEELKKKVKK